MKKILLVAVLTLAACGPNADEFREASPSRQGIDIKAPAGRGQALTAELGQSEQALLGQTADWYLVTVAATTAVNGGVAWVLNLCEEIVKYPPTTIDEDKAVWGPHTEPLSPDTFKFTVQRDGNHFLYALEGKPKDAPDSAFVAVISGRHEPAGENAGKGNFLIDWNAAKALARQPNEVGSADVTYDRNEARDVKVGVRFIQVRDNETGQLVDADYAFAQASGGDGSFEFVIKKDMQNNASQLERISIVSRWHQDGAGRCDLKISGGDVPGSVTGSECWDEMFKRTYYTDTANFRPTEGDEASCVFDGAMYSAL